MKYVSQITAIGELAENLLQTNKSIILVNDMFSQNLVNTLAVQHASAPLKKMIQAGDTLRWGETLFKISDVGTEANQTFREAGHCTLVFNKNIEMPGQIAVEGDALPALEIGTEIQIG